MKKVLSLILCAAILLGIAPLSALPVSAEEVLTTATNAESADEVDTSGLTVQDSATIAPSGSVRWTLYTNGLLEFSGTGVIPSYAKWASPWYQYSSFITEILVRKTITEIGSSAFFGCNNVTKITLPFVGRDRKTTTGVASAFGYIFGYSSENAYELECYNYVKASDLPIRVFYHSHRYRNMVFDIDLKTKSGFYEAKYPDVTTYNMQPFTCSVRMQPELWHNQDDPYRKSYVKITDFVPLSLKGSTTNGNFSCYDYKVDGNPYYWLQTYTFNVPSSLKTVNITDASQIADGAFFACSSITQINLNDCIQEIGAYAFYRTSWYNG